MMLSLISLTATPSNRTSSARADHVTGWRVTMNYSFVIQAVIQFVTQAVSAVREGWAEGSLRARKCMLNQCSDYDDG